MERRPLLLLVIITILGAVLRFDFTYPFNFIIDSDEAIVGLMAKHVLEGSTIPTFYYGQHYMGSFEAIVTALFFALFGVSNWALKLTPFLFSITLIPIVYLLAKRCANANVALIAALLTAIPPAPLVVWSSKARGGFIEVIVIGALALLATITWLQREKPCLRLTATVALLLGLGWWINNQIIFFIAPIGLVFFQHLIRQPTEIRLSGFLRHGGIGVLGFFLGGLPFWIYNLTHNFVTFEMFSGAESTDLAEHFEGLFSSALPIILGGKRFWQEDEFLPAGDVISLTLYGSLLVWVMFLRAIPLLKASVFCGFSRREPWEIFTFFVLATVTIFTVSSFGYLVQAPRYLLPVYVGLMPLCAYGALRLGRVIGTFVILLILSLNLASSYLGEKAIPGEPFVAGGERASRDHSELITWLDENNYTLVKTNYWIGYRLAFETKERVKFLMFQEPYKIRIKEYQELERGISENRTPLILVPSQAKIARKALQVLGGTYKEKLLSGYSVIYDISRQQEIDALTPISSQDISPSATHHSQQAALATDGQVETRWGSGIHQSPGMRFVIVLNRPRIVRGFKIDLGAWSHDHPRQLDVIFHLADGSSRTLFSRYDFYAVEYLLYEHPLALVTGPLTTTSIELVQSGSHPLFDWSIAEITLYE